MNLGQNLQMWRRMQHLLESEVKLGPQKWVHQLPTSCSLAKSQSDINLSTWKLCIYMTYQYVGGVQGYRDFQQTQWNVTRHGSTFFALPTFSYLSGPE